MAVHDTAFDSEFKQSGWLGRYGVEQDFGEHLRVYLQHQSMMDEIEKDGSGQNEIGIDVKYKIKLW